LFGRRPQSAAQNFKEHHAKVHPVLEYGQKIPAVQHQEFAICQRGRVRASRLAIEHGDLAENLAGIENPENDLLAAVRKRTDFDAAAEDRHQALARRSFGEDLAPGSIALDPGIADQGIYLIGVQFAKQEMTLEDLPLFVVACW